MGRSDDNFRLFGRQLWGDLVWGWEDFSGDWVARAGVVFGESGREDRELNRVCFAARQSAMWGDAGRGG